MLDYGLRDKVVCVTGGASGIGKEVAVALLHGGAKVAVIDLVKESIDRFDAEFSKDRDHFSTHVLDVRDSVGFADVVKRIESRFGAIDGLVACAGISGAGRAEALSQPEWDKVMSVNVTGTLVACQQVGIGMIERRNGAIVIVGSVDGMGGHPGRTHYVTSKFAVTGMMKNLALEWGQHNVRVNGVAPNMVDTELLRKGIPDRFLNEVVIDRTPLGRIAAPAEVASAAIMLLTDAASYITGVMLAVDGGLTAGHYTHQHGADLSSNRLLAEGIYQEQ